MKVVFLTDQLYKSGGIEKVTSIKANYMADVWGWKVFIITTEQNGNPPFFHFSDKIEWLDLGINYHRTMSYYHPKNLLKVFQHFIRLKRILNQIQPDAVIYPHFAPDFFFLPFIHRKSKKIKEFHGSGFRRKRGGIVDFILKKYDKVVLLNPSEQDFYPIENSLVIPNPYEKKGRFEKKDFPKRVLAAGRIAPVKRFEHLIQVWEKIHKQFPDWELHIFGEDYLDTRTKLLQLIDELGMKKSVFIYDAVHDLEERMKEYSIYAMTSETECFPMVLLEALAHGLPVVCYDCPTGPRHIISNGVDGFLVESGNIDTFAQILGQLMADVVLVQKMSKAAEINVKKYSIAKVMPLWRQLMKNN